MNLAAFEAFVKVMETGSISLAADQLLLPSLPSPNVFTVWKNTLESNCLNLPDVAYRPPMRHSLLPKVKNWLNELGDIHYTLSHEQALVQGKLKIGTSHHIGLHHLPSHLRRYVQAYPDVTLDVHFVDSEQAHEQVIAGDLELAFLTLPPRGDARLNYVTIWNDPLVFVVAPFHSLAQQKICLWKICSTIQACYPLHKLIPPRSPWQSLKNRALNRKSA